VGGLGVCLHVHAWVRVRGGGGGGEVCARRPSMGTRGKGVCVCVGPRHACVLSQHTTSGMNNPNVRTRQLRAPADRQTHRLKPSLQGRPSTACSAPCTAISGTPDVFSKLPWTSKYLQSDGAPHRSGRCASGCVHTRYTCAHSNVGGAAGTGASSDARAPDGAGRVGAQRHGSGPVQQHCAVQVLHARLGGGERREEQPLASRAHIGGGGFPSADKSPGCTRARAPEGRGIL
jgi:hypothetical protein